MRLACFCRGLCDREDVRYHVQSRIGKSHSMKSIQCPVTADVVLVSLRYTWGEWSSELAANAGMDF